MDYSSLVTSLATLTAIDETDANFLLMVPDAIDYAEARIYRELNLLATGVRDGTGSLAAASRNFTLPTPSGGGTWLVVESANVITPASTAPDSGTRVPLLKTTQQFIDLIGASPTGADVPSAFAMVTTDTLIVGPVPAGAYRLEIVGTVQPAALSATNTTTILTDEFPALFEVACMIFLAGYMQNYGAQADDPRQAQSWETQYQTLKASSETEEARKRVTAFSGRSVAGTPRAA